MAVGVFIRSDKVLLKGKDPLFSQVRQTFCQCLLPASQALAAYLLPALPQHGLRRGAGMGRVGRLSPRSPGIGKAPLASEVGKGMESNAPEMSSPGLGIWGALETPTLCLSLCRACLCEPSCPPPGSCLGLSSAAVTYWLCDLSEYPL